MKKSTLIVQRFYYDFREGFFEYLEDINYDFKLINATSPRGKVRINNSNLDNKKYLLKTICFFLGEKYVVFPFLFFNLIFLSPRVIVSEGGVNTINNIQIYFYSKFFRRKYIIWDVGKGYGDFEGNFFRRLYMQVYRLILRHAYLIYGYNSQSSNYFQTLGIDKEKVIVLNNTIDTRKISKTKSEKHNLFPNELKPFRDKKFTYLIYVGALVKSKNVEFLADLMKALGSTYFLIIVGDGPDSYKNLLKQELNGTNHIFVGYKKNNELKPYYDLASFSILPGLGGLSINQSMAYGKPVICRKADGTEKDLIIENKTGYVYNELEDLYHYIISRKPEDWTRMGQFAEEFIYANYSVEKMMDKFVSHIKDIT